MKRSIFLLVLGSFLLAFALAACAATATPVPATEAPASLPTDTAVPASDPTATPAASGAPRFASDVLPILQNRCLACHSGNSARAGVQLDSYAALMGSKRGTLVLPGDPANSLLAQIIQSGRMPKGGGKVTADELQIIMDWIAAGARDN